MAQVYWDPAKNQWLDAGGRLTTPQLGDQNVDIYNTRGLDLSENGAMPSPITLADIAHASQPASQGAWNPNTPVPDYFNTPQGWDTANWGPYWGFRDRTQDYKSDRTKIPNIQDFIGAQNMSYVNSSNAGYGTNDIFGRPWNSDPEIANQKAHIDTQYQNAIADYNRMYGTNIQADASVLGPNAANSARQLSGGGETFMRANPNEGAARMAAMGVGSVLGAGLLSGALSGANVPATGGALDAGSAVGGAGTATGGLPESYWNTLANAGGTISDAPAVNAGTIGGGAGSGTSGVFADVPISASADWTGLNPAGGVFGAPAAGTTGGGLMDILNRAASPESLAQSAGSQAIQQIAGSNGGSPVPTTTDANGNIFDQNGTPYGPPSSSTAGGTVPDSTTIPGSAAAGAGTALMRLLNGNATPEDYLSLGGTTLSTLLSAYNDYNKSGQAKDLASQYAAYGAPSRARYEASFAPGFKPTDIPGYQSALDNSWETALRKASVGGNPVNNPGVMAEINKYVVGGTALPAIQQYQNQNAATGGYNAFNTAAPGAASSAISNSGNYLSDLTGGLSQILNPKQNTQNDLMSLLNNFKGYFSPS